jgi:Ran GTPase-activating protein (RanGAP) involved in mRNA processing and transport
LNISDNRIGNAGLQALSAGLDQNCGLISFNLSNNNLSGEAAISVITKYMRSNRNIEKFDISSNAIGDSAIVQFTDALGENAIRLKSLTFEQCGISTEGAI